jgi:glycosyltransferase involved in cell wall biosynthesis
VSTPVVSVILPTYRRGDLIGRALRSVLAQSFRDLEVLVLDDMPGDNTEEVVRALADPRVRYVSHPTRRGVAAARNQGLALARGEFVAFQDSDDEWLTDKLAQQLERLRSLPVEVALTQAAVLRYEAGQARYFLTALPERGQASAILALNYTSYLQGWLARRSALLDAGGFDERLTLWEDWELSVRVCQKYRIDLDARPVAVIYDTPVSLIKNVQWRTQMLEVILAKHRALMHTCPRALAVNLYALGRFQLLEGNASIARRTLWESLRLQPLRLKTWAALALSLLRTSVVQKIFQWRESRT